MGASFESLAMSDFLRGSFEPSATPRFALGRVVATPARFN
jgi:hypothetical protein